MEQVFFRLHVRFVSTVTRLLSPKTRRALEYVTLANAFLLVVSLAWLHTRFVNPKGRQGSAVSCLPAALSRAGVDPAQLHVLQVPFCVPSMPPKLLLCPYLVLMPNKIHIRFPPDDRGGSGGTGGRRKNSFLPPEGGSGGGSDDGTGISNPEQLSDRCRHRSGCAHMAGDGAAGSNVGGGGYGPSETCDRIGEERESNNGEEARGSAIGCAVPTDNMSRGGNSAGSPSVGLESAPQNPEIFYSMKLVTGKDAVGTLSGPGTLGIEKRMVVDAGEAREGVDAFQSKSGGGVGEVLYVEEVEGKRSTVVQTLVDAFSWGKVEGGPTKALSGEGAPRSGDSGGQATPGWKDGEGDHFHQCTGLRTARTDVCAPMDDTTPPSDVFVSLDVQRHQWGGASAEEMRREGQGGGNQQEQHRLQDEVYLYSLEKGFLMLRPDLRRKHGIVTANVTIDAHDPCLGGTVIQALVKDFVGYDTVVMNWLISLYGGRGFLYGVHNNELFNLNYAAEFVESTEDLGKFVVFKVGVVFTTLFLFFTTTTLVSFTLRETQERMLKFTFLLQHHVRHRLPYAPLIFTHVVESLVFVPIMVGILFFLFEFFSDQLLAFMVLSVVWLCEVYSVVSVRTSVCIRFFPQVFFLYFTLFHVYFFSFPFGFSYLALVTTVLFLQHSMLFCWNRFEVPALRTGLISASRPRQAGMVIGVIPRYDPHGMGMPYVPQPGASSSVGNSDGDGEGSPPARRQRAATASSLEQARDSIVSAARGVGRVIPRSNSSPDPTSFSSPLGSGSHRGGSGGGSGGGGDNPTAGALPADVLDAPTATSSGPVPIPAGPVAAERLLVREWGSGSGGAGNDSRVDGSTGDPAMGDVSAPLLGSSSLPSWNAAPMSTPVRQREMASARATTDVATTATSEPLSVEAAPFESETAWRRRRSGAAGKEEGGPQETQLPDVDDPSVPCFRREAVAAVTAATAATAAVVVDDGGSSIRPPDAKVVGGDFTRKPAATTKPLEEQVEGTIASASKRLTSPSSSSSAAAAGAPASDEAPSAPAVAVRDCGHTSTQRDPGDTTQAVDDKSIPEGSNLGDAGDGMLVMGESLPTSQAPGGPKSGSRHAFGDERPGGR